MSFLLEETRPAFGVVFEIERDLCYGVYALVVVALFTLWPRSAGYDLAAAAPAPLVPGPRPRAG